jgi:hypothetical protein
VTEASGVEEERGEARRWLLLVYRIKAESSGRRTYVWRQLRQLGAVYLQQAVAVLPDRAGLRGELDRLGQRDPEHERHFATQAASPSRVWEDDSSPASAARDAGGPGGVEARGRDRRETRRKRFRFAEPRRAGGLGRLNAGSRLMDATSRGCRSGGGRAALRAGAALDQFTKEVYRAEAE